MSDDDKFVPKGISLSDDQEDAGNLMIQNLVKKNDRVKLRLGGNDKTPNRDGFIELRADGIVIGKLEAQVKPVDRPRKDKKGHLCYQLPASLVGHSLVAGLPVVLICYDRDTEKAYWKHVTKALFDGAEGQNSRTIDFVAQDEIGDGFPYTDSWFELSAKHLEALKLGAMVREAMEQIGGDKGFTGALDSPEAFAELLKRVQDTAGEKYKTRLEEAQKLFNDFEIVAATKILAPLAEEMAKDKQPANLLFDVFIWLGNCRYRLEEFTKAEDCFREAMKLEPENPRAQTNVAHILYVRNSDKKEAIALAKAGYDKRPDHEHTIATYLMCLSFNKDINKLEEIVCERKELVEKSSVLKLALGQVAKEHGDYASASTLFKKAIELDGKNFHARILYAEGVYKQARASGLKLIDEGIVPDPEASGKELNDAVAELGIAIEFFTKTTDRAALYRAYDIRSVIYMIRGNFDKALADCEKMDAVIPDKEFAKIVRAQIYTQLDRFDEVIPLLEPLVGGGRRDVLQALAYSHYRLKHWDEAASYFTKYINEDSDSDSERLAYIQCLQFSGDKKKAYQLARKLRIAGRAPFVVMREVELHRLLELQDWAGAIEVIEDLIKAAPANGEPWIQRVVMYFNLRNRQRAMKFYAELPHDVIERDDWARHYLAEFEGKLRLVGWL